MDKQILEQLYAPFEVKERQGQGNRKFSYVPSKDIFDRMNKVFMGNWSVDVINKEVIEDSVLVHVKVSVIDPTNSSGPMFWQDGFASHQLFRYTSGPNKGQVIDIGNSYRSAMSKAIKAACARWGVGLYLEDDDAQSDSSGMGAFTPSGGYSAPSMPSTNVPPVQTGGTPSFPTTLPPSVQKPTAPVVDSVPAPPVVSAPPVNSVPESPAPFSGNSFPPSSMFDSSLNVKPTDQTLSGGFAPSSAQQPPFNTASGGERLTDVQKVAIETTLLAHKLTYEDLVKRALGIEGDIPAIETLTYKDAVKLIQFGNNLNA